MLRDSMRAASLLASHLARGTRDASTSKHQIGAWAPHKTFFREGFFIYVKLYTYIYHNIYLIFTQHCILLSKELLYLSGGIQSDHGGWVNCIQVLIR